jgi:hypothetical protein
MNRRILPALLPLAALVTPTEAPAADRHDRLI